MTLLIRPSSLSSVKNPPLELCSLLRSYSKYFPYYQRYSSGHRVSYQSLITSQRSFFLSLCRNGITACRWSCLSFVHVIWSIIAPISTIPRSIVGRGSSSELLFRFEPVQSCESSLRWREGLGGGHLVRSCECPCALFDVYRLY